MNPEISRRTIVISAAAIVLLVGGAGAWIASTGASDEPAIGGPFTLVDGTGKTVTDRDLRGSYALIYFGYTFCPDVCPTTLNDVAQALQMLGPAGERVRPVFITIDPKRDTPDVVRTYVAAFSPRLIGLTGTAEQVAAAARAYKVYYAEHRTGEGAADYTMDHSSLLYLVGPDGRFIAPIGADQPPRDMATEIARRLG